VVAPAAGNSGRLGSTERPVYAPQVSYDGYGCGGSSQRDAELIAATRNALPWLLDVAHAVAQLLDEVGVEQMCSGLSVTEYGCAGCPAHDAARALAGLDTDTDVHR